VKPNDNSSKRVVVTGIGVLSPLGLNMPDTWQGLVKGKSGIDYITLFDATEYKTRFAGEVKGFEPTDYISRKKARHMDRFTQLSVVASLQALEQSGIEVNDGNEDSLGVLIGSGTGGLITIAQQVAVLLEKGPDKVNPFLVPMMMGDAASSQVSILLGAKGPNLCATSACSSGADAIGLAYEVIKRGDAKAMIAGGSESIVTPIGIAAFNACKAISTRNDEPQKASRPFDIERDGFIVGEGAGVLILEEYEVAKERNAEILAEVAAYGASGDAYHMTQPCEDGEGGVRAMKMALEKGGLKPADIDYINAHGTSTQLNDKIETMAIKRVFGDRAYQIPVSSTKSMLGHLLGGSGAVESAICIMAIKEGIIPPTINLTNRDPECDLDYVPDIARKQKISVALSNSFGFGGHNSTLIFRRYSEAGD